MPPLHPDDSRPATNDAIPDPTVSAGVSFGRYLTLYALAFMSIAAVWGASGILIPLHLQQIEFARFFTGRDAGVDLQALTALKLRIADGLALATPEQARLLDLMAAFDAARAARVAIVTSTGVAFTMVIQPLVGILSDRTRSRWGRRAPWIAAGALGSALGLVGFFLSTTVLMLAIAWSVVGVATNAAAGPLGATVPDRVPLARIGTVSALSGLGGLLGLVLGSAAAGALFAATGPAAYLPFAVLVLVLPLLFVAGARDRSSAHLPVTPLTAAGYVKAFTIALRTRDFRWVWIAKVALMFGYAVSTALSVYMLQSYVRPALNVTDAAHTAPLLLLVALPGTLIAMVVAGRWSDRAGRRKPFVIGSSLLFAASMVIPLVWPTITALFVQSAIAGVALGSFLVVDQALLIDVLPDKDAAGRDLGIGHLAGNLGQALGPVLAGAIVASTGSYRLIWLCAIALVLIAAAAVLPVRRAR